jgi:hypothetical protein
MAFHIELLYWLQKMWCAVASIMMQYALMMSASLGAGILALSHWAPPWIFLWLCFAQSVLCCHDYKIEKGNYKIDNHYKLMNFYNRSTKIIKLMIIKKKTSTLCHG